ncbi:MFS general substrate transporter, partial [Auriscalpium vulgare]
IKRRFGRYLHIYTLCSLFASLGGFFFGFDTGSIGPVIVMPAFVLQFHLHSPVLQGLVVSIILLTASLASLFAGVLSDRISRTRTFAIGGAVFSIGSVLCASASSLPLLIFGRCIAGIGEGLFQSTVTVYILEIAPTQYRGRLSCTTQLYVTIGLAAGYFTSYGTVKLSPSSLSWRLLFVMQALVSAAFAAGSLTLPHSPRWLQHVGHTEDAARAWARLGFTAAEAEKEQEVVQREERQEAQAEALAEDIGGQPEEHAANANALLSAQACGIDGVLYYAPVLFSQAGLPSTTSSLHASGVSGILNIACTVITQIFTDHWGRRTSMIRGGSGTL